MGNMEKEKQTIVNAILGTKEIQQRGSENKIILVGKSAKRGK